MPVLIRHLVLLPVKAFVLYVLVLLGTLFLKGWMWFDPIGWAVLIWGTVIWMLVHFTRDMRDLMK